MKMYIGRVLTITEPSKAFIKWCNDNLVVNNTEYEKKARMGFWVGNIPKKIKLYSVVDGKYILPYGCLQLIPTVILMDMAVESRFKPITEYIAYNANVPLYDYQEVAVTSMIVAQMGILQSPAGSGKTQMGISLIARLGLKALWLCHTLDLVKQSKERAEQYIDKKHLGVIKEGHVDIGSGITFATVQTMSKMDLEPYRNYWDVIIVDECHRVSQNPTSVTMYQRVLDSLAARHKYGLSATVHRADGMIMATYSMLGGIAYKVPNSAVADKIMQVAIKPVVTGLGINRVALNPDGTLNYTKLVSYLTENDARNELIVSSLCLEEGHSCLILSDRLDHLKDMMRRLPSKMQRDAVMISGKMTSKTGKKQREQAIADMRTGKKKYLFATYSLAKEGLDIPRLDRLFMTTPQADEAVVIQSIGRVARTDTGKQQPIAYDFVDSFQWATKRFKVRCKYYKRIDCTFVED